MSIISGAIKGTAVFVVGMNLIGVGLWLNGEDQPSNVAWQMVSAFYDFELSVLAVLLTLAIVAAIFMYTQTLREKTASDDCKVSHAETRFEQTHIKTTALVDAVVSSEQIAEIPTSLEKTAQPTPANTHLPSLEESLEAPQMSADELKQKVLRELTGRS